MNRLARDQTLFLGRRLQGTQPSRGRWEGCGPPRGEAAIRATQRVAVGFGRMPNRADASGGASELANVAALRLGWLRPVKGEILEEGVRRQRWIFPGLRIAASEGLPSKHQFSSAERPRVGRPVGTQRASPSCGPGRWAAAVPRAFGAVVEFSKTVPPAGLQSKYKIKPRFSANEERFCAAD